MCPFWGSAKLSQQPFNYGGSMGRTLSYIGAGLLFLFGLCVVVYAVMLLIGSTDPVSGNSSWTTWGFGFGCFGILLLAGGAGLIWLAMRGQKTEVVQQVTMQVDLPGETKVEQMKCKSCGEVAHHRQHQAGQRRACGQLPLLQDRVPTHRRTQMVI